MEKRYAGLLAAVALTGCATAEPLGFSTPSGRPEAIFYNQSAADVAGKLGNLCLDRGHVLVDSTAYQVTCKGELGVFQAALIQTLMTNSYATTPELYVRFTLASTGGNVRVQAYEWVEST